VKAVSLVLLVTLGAACRRVDPKQELDVEGVETYWVVDSSKGGTQYLAPAIRLSVRNKGAREHRSIEATATFRRKGEKEAWGSDWQRVAPGSKPLAAGQKAILVMRSDGRYYSEGAPETMLAHELFKDANVEVFLRVGSSPWVKFVETAVERRIGSRAADTDGR
jgi:hypothetical protein